MKLFYLLLFIPLICISFVSCKGASPQSLPQNTPEPLLEPVQKTISESVPEDGFILMLSATGISKDMKTIKIKADLKNVSEEDKTTTVSECRPDHLYDVSVNKGEYFESIAIRHIKFCGVDKRFKPGEVYSTVLPISYKEPVKTIKVRYSLGKGYIESNEIEVSLP